MAIRVAVGSQTEQECLERQDDPDQMEQDVRIPDLRERPERRKQKHQVKEHPEEPRRCDDPRADVV